jgi:hypothetical protein
MRLDPLEALFQRYRARKSYAFYRESGLRRDPARILKRPTDVAVSAGFENCSLCHDVNVSEFMMRNEWIA